MLFDIPLIWGSVLTTVFVVVMLFTNSYKKIVRSIIAFVSVIGLSLIYELFLVKIDWPLAAQGWVTPSFPHGSMLIIMLSLIHIYRRILKNIMMRYYSRIKYR